MKVLQQQLEFGAQIYCVVQQHILPGQDLTDSRKNSFSHVTYFFSLKSSPSVA